MKQIIGKKLNEAAINSLLTDVRKLDDDGASIYIGCFILGNNFDYRFTFLILTIPQMVSWIYIKEKKG